MSELQIGWHLAPASEADGRAPVDIGPVAEPGARYRFVRLTEIHEPDPSTPAKTVPNAGPDIDAVGAIHAEPLR